MPTVAGIKKNTVDEIGRAEGDDESRPVIFRIDAEVISFASIIRR